MKGIALLGCQELKIPKPLRPSMGEIMRAGSLVIGFMIPSSNISIAGTGAVCNDHAPEL